MTLGSVFFFENNFSQVFVADAFVGFRPNTTFNETVLCFGEDK